MKQIAIILILLLSFSAFSQRKKKELLVDDKVLVEGDSIEFSLDEVVLLKKLKFHSKKERNYYYWYWKKIHKIKFEYRHYR